MINFMYFIRLLKYNITRLILRHESKHTMDTLKFLEETYITRNALKGALNI